MLHGTLHKLVVYNVIQQSLGILYDRHIGITGYDVFASCIVVTTDKIKIAILYKQK